MKKSPSPKRPGKVLLLTFALFVTLTGFAQERKLPDGSIIYSDGTRKLPNGTVIYRDGSVASSGTGGGVLLPDGSVVYGDGREQNRNSNKRHRSRKAGWLPPGQAKKIYGGSAKDYAPGQQKEWKRKGKGRKN